MDATVAVEVDATTVYDVVQGSVTVTVSGPDVVSLVVIAVVTTVCVSQAVQTWVVVERAVCVRVEVTYTVEPGAVSVGDSTTV